MQILAISGSLRAASTNTTLLKAAAALAPEDVSLNASPRAGYAQASLVETLTVMSAKVVPEACILVPLLGKNLDENGVISEADLCRVVRSALRAFAPATSIHGQ